MKAAVVTVSDRSAAGIRPDGSGPLAAELLSALGFDTTVAVVPDDAPSIMTALRSALSEHVDLLITTGGSGLGPRDVTPEATTAVIDRPAPGLADLVRRAGDVPTAALSRGVAGVAGTTLVVNLAGSLGAVRDGIGALAPLLPHVVSQLHGGDH
ncbi:MAG: molybdenum cofactor biosynthesis protein B [Actinomycetes bacterium]